MKNKEVWGKGVIKDIIGIIIMLGMLIYVYKSNLPDKPIFIGFASGLGFASIARVIKRFYWSQDSKAEKYEEKRRLQRINLQDERKTMLRDRAGRMAYLTSIVTKAVLFLVLMFLKMFQIYEAPSILMIFIVGYMVLEYILGVFIFRRLEEKY